MRGFLQNASKKKQDTIRLSLNLPKSKRIHENAISHRYANRKTYADTYFATQKYMRGI